jgi:hypothetical protein
MTQLPNHDSSVSLLAPLARGLMHRAPAILALSVHDANGHALWSSGDFLLAEDDALIAGVVEDPHDVRGPSSGLWWESADTARARCALALFEGGEFCGVLLAVYPGTRLQEAERTAHVARLLETLPVLARAIVGVETDFVDTNPSMIVPAEFTALRFDTAVPDGLAADLAAVEREEQMLALIDAALREDEFALHLQPVASLRDESCAGATPLIVEVLIRLPTEEFGELAPHQFLDIAERHGRMPAIDRWVIRALLVWMQRNRDQWADANAVFSVSLCGKSVVRPDFRHYLEHCLDKSGLPLDALRFEIAELDTGIAPREFAALARALADRGCEVSVDARPVVEHAGTDRRLPRPDLDDYGFLACGMQVATPEAA